MAATKQRTILRRHTVAIVPYLDDIEDVRRNLNENSSGLSIKCVIQEFLDDGLRIGDDL